DNTVEPFYSGFKDVTSLVSGNGTYTLTNLNISTGNPWNTNQTVLGGWALIVIYSNNGTESNRVINIYDGFQAFQNSNITLNPANFEIPATGINGKFAVITWEGDSTLSGNETLQFNSNTLTDACNGTNNQYNSTINTLTCTGNAATDDVYYGVDIDTFDISSYLAANQTSATTFYQSGQDAVMLSAQVISVSDVPVSDLSITKSHIGNFSVGSNGSYTIAIHNNGPAATSGTTTVTDPLPTGLTFVSGTGTGWSCSAVGQNVTCTTTTSIANGGNANPITLTVAVGSSAANPTNNTATVAVDSSIFDNISSNNSSTDATTILKPDLSTSTKDVVDTNGGDSNPGDTLEYTITLNETGGLGATNASVTDNMPAGITGFTVVSKPGGSTDSSTSTGGSNGTGYLNITGISVPANGSATIVYDVTVAATDSPGDTIDNTATVTNPNGPGASPAAPTVTVSQSQVPASGNKLLYVYDNSSMTRTPQTAAGGGVTINQNATNNWTLTTALQKPLTLIANSTVSVTLLVECTSTRFGNCRNGGNLHWNAALYDNTVSAGTQIGGTSPNASFNDTNYTQETANITIGATDVTVAAGHQLILRITNDSSSNRAMQIEQYNGGDLSIVSLDVSTVINVDSVTTYSDATCTTVLTNPIYETQSPVYICAIVSDPFGSADIDPATGGTAPTLALDDADGANQLSAVSMTQVADSGAATKTFEYTYTVPTAPPATLALGNWTPAVTAWEGTEHTISHTADGAFDVEAPNLLVMKAVSAVSDPVEGTTRPKAMPGATMQYLVNVSNQGKGAADNNTLTITDPIPANSSFVVGSVVFTDGSPASGLMLSAAN
ncbi:MAG: beta strand repeat-containing protein, partial [Gammaproteobacteria bacterium]